MKYSLSGIWSVTGVDRGDESKRLTMQARVPGNIELDLYRNGVEPDPFFGTNEFLYKKYETWDWEFTRRFTAPKYDKNAQDISLVFEGINCVSEIYLDDERIDALSNSLVPHVIALNDLASGREYELKVKIKSALLEAASGDFPAHVTACEGSDEYTRLRMPAHSFGWDIMPRFPSAGMWRDVYLEVRPVSRIEQTYFVTRRCDERSAKLNYKYRLRLNGTDFSDYTIRVWFDGELKAETNVRFVSGEGDIYVDRPRLWWPNGYGKPETYTARTELYYKGVLIDRKTETVGIRTAEIVHEMKSGDEGEFLIKLNGCPILAKGSNWVPLDAFHSRDAQRYEQAVKLFTESNCNIMRLWGGNVYEDDRLFELCDKNGILIWHDFAFACAVYPHDESLLDEIRREAASVITRLRNHPCILLWAGDNEIDETYSGRSYYTASNRYNPISREILAECVRENDPYRMYLPSSPYIDKGVARYDVPEQHLWGARAYYKDDFYRLNRAHFVSEYGYHGCPSPESIKKFIPEDELNNMKSPSWRCHSSEYTLLFKRGYDRNQLMRDQVELMFGSGAFELETFSFLSQFTQAEALKFMIEQTRIRKWRRTGLIWWNMLDGWPQISDSVVDWYFVKKRAYRAVTRAQEPISVIIDEVSGWYRQVFISNDSLRDARVTVAVSDADSGERLFEGEFSSRANELKNIGEFRVMPSKRQLLLIDYTVDGEKRRSHYLGGFPPFEIEDARRWARLIDEE